MSLHDFIFLSLHHQAVKISNCIDNILLEANTELHKSGNENNAEKSIIASHSAIVDFTKLSYYVENFEKKSKCHDLADRAYKEFFIANSVVDKTNLKAVADYLQRLQIIVCKRVGIKKIESDYSNLTEYGKKLDETTETKDSKRSLKVLLDNVRSPYNVGSIIRTSEAFGFGTIYLTGVSATIDEKKIQRTSMSSEKFIDIVKLYEKEELEQTLILLKNSNYRIVAVEKTPVSTPLNTFTCHENCLIIIGNEEFGIQEYLLDYCDSQLLIPLYGIKNSLNVSNAFSIAAYWFANYC